MGYVNSGGSLGMALKVGFNCRPSGIVNIPYGLTSIGAYAFYKCTEVTSFNIPGTVTWIYGSAFEGCTGLTELTIPYNVDGLGNGVLVNQQALFKDCTNLTTFNINTVKYLSIGKDIFLNCTSLTTLNTLPGFKPSFLNMVSCPLSHTSILNMFNNISTTSVSTLTLGATNLAKMSAAEKLIATNKGWTLA